MANRVTRTGGPAFPIECNIANGFRDDSGLTMRDWFAGQALGSGIIDGHGLSDSQLTELFGPYKTSIREEEVAAAIAYRIADAMIAHKLATDPKHTVEEPF